MRKSEEGIFIGMKRFLNKFEEKLIVLLIVYFFVKNIFRVIEFIKVVIGI